MKEKNETILAVDDHYANLILIQEFLKDSGYNIHSAQDGEEAWAMLSDSPHLYAAVLLDRMMPKMDGLTVLKKNEKSRCPEANTGDFSNLYETGGRDRRRD